VHAGVKLAKAWSAGDSVLKESWIKLRTMQLRLKLQSVNEVTIGVGR
jgi:hypothetical protein